MSRGLWIIFSVCLLAMVAAVASADPIVFEAEHGVDVKLNYEIKEVKGASGGLALTLPEGAGGTFGYGSNTNPDVFVGQVKYNFVVREAGEYMVSSRVFWMDKCGNSIRVSIDSGQRVVLRSPDKAVHTFQKWYWESSGPFQLAEGKHVLTATACEDGPTVDRWCIRRPNETPSDSMKENWPGKFLDHSLKPVSLSLSKPSEHIPEDGKLPVTIWVRKCKKGTVRSAFVVKGPDEMSVEPGAKFETELGEDETLKSFDIVLEFPKETPRNEKRIRVFALDDKGMVTSSTMCILARPYDWWILGALPVPAGIERDLAFGNRVNLGESVQVHKESDGSKFEWQRLPRKAFNPYQTIDFERIYGQSVSLVAYLYTEIEVAEDGSYLMLVNNDGAVNVWIDGKEAYVDHGHHPSVGWLRHRSIDMMKGKHRILVKVEQNQKPDADFIQNYWHFRLRLRKSRNRPAAIRGLECGPR